MTSASLAFRLVKPAVIALVVLAGLLFAADLAVAQDTVAAPAQTIDPATGALPNFRDLFEYSPVINGAILGLSVLSVLLFLFLLLTVNSRSMVPADLVDELTKLVMRGKYEAVADLCRAHRRVFIASIVQRCAENAGKPHALLMNIVDSEGRRRAEIVWNRVSYLADIANVAPMLGLLGTVLGMIQAFFTLETESAALTSKLLASGIGKAMSTTMFGLFVAIGTLMLYSMIKSRATRALAEAEQAVHSIADHMKRATPGMRDESATGSVASSSPLRPRPRPAGAGSMAGEDA